MAKLSIIIPLVREYPQVLFTIRSLLEECKGLDFEIVAIDNYCQEVRDQNGGGQENDRGAAQIKAQSRYIPELISLEYSDKLSHWCAKNVGCEAATGDVFLFLDAHVVPSRDAIQKMFQYYVHHEEELNGTLHLPVSYHILESKRLIYKMVDEQERGWLHYSFTGYRDEPEPYEVPCMSMCGCMMSRKIYERLGGWPKAFSAYGGGENYVNFTLAIMGMKKWIFPNATIHHFGAKRGYHWTYDNHLVNKAIAMYCIGGGEWLSRFFQHSKGRPETLKKMEAHVLKTCGAHRELIKSQQVITIEEWIDTWKIKSGE